MTDKEINEAVARGLGWTEWILQPHQMTYMHRISYGGKCIDGCNKIIPPVLPDYCHSIAAAWEIFKFLEGKNITLALSYDEPEWSWYCNLHDNKNCKWSDADAASAPMAICLAFLKLNEKEVS